MRNQTIHVKYACVDGAHFFTAGDELSKGLCVAHECLETAYAEVTAQLTYLLTNNHGLQGEVEPAQAVQDFESWLEELTQVKRPTITVVPAGVVRWAQREREAAL